MRNLGGQRPGQVFRDLTSVTALNPNSNTFLVAFVPQFIQPYAVFMRQVAMRIGSFVICAGNDALIFALTANTKWLPITRPTVHKWRTRTGGARFVGMDILSAPFRRAT
jgi:threonine/homoserine/homoserine lactone efflux protein